MCGVCVVKSDESLPTVTGVGAAITSATSRAAGKRGGNLGFVETRSASQVKVGISGFSDAQSEVVTYETIVQSADGTRRHWRWTDQLKREPAASGGQERASGAYVWA